jgi:beta-ureidopropionase
VRPARQILAEASEDKDELVVADLDLDMIDEVRKTWQFYRDRRPDAYRRRARLIRGTRRSPCGQDRPR